MGLLPSVNCFASESSSDSFITDKQLVTSYNNYYEFSTNKKMVKHLAQELDISNWSLHIDGLVDNPMQLSMSDIFDMKLIKRTYRLRCVEGWSAVIPWQGILLRDILALARPTIKHGFVKFSSIYAPSVMLGQRTNILPWPYIEGLRLDEAMHPLTLLATGMYDAPLPKQNGAPIRLVVPWKYGYKSIKAVSKITLTDTRFESSWMQSSPSEYGFYANVNPNVAHPRWSQRREVPLGQTKKIKTRMFNGYAEQVASLYKSDNVDKLY